MKKSTKSGKGQIEDSPATKRQGKKSSSKSKIEKSKSTSKLSQKKASVKKPVKRVISGQSKSILATTSKSDEVKSDLMPSMTFATASLAPGKTYEPGMPFRLERLLTPEEVGWEYAARHKELEADFARARKTLKKWRTSLVKQEDFGKITGVSVRFRTKFGQVVSPLKVAIVINVERKRSVESLERLGLKKFEDIDGVPVKVVEGSFSLISESASFLRGQASPVTPVSFSDPIVGGAAISPPGNPSAFGTLGLVTVATDKTPFGISCQHVVSNSVDQISPGGSARQIGNVKASRPPAKDFEKGAIKESLDCSLFEFITNADQPIKFPGPGSWAYGLTGDVYLAGRRVNSTEKAVIDVYKFGVGFGELVIGRIEDDLRDVSIDGVAYVNNFSVVHKEDSGRTFAVPGDSGSVLFVKGIVNGADAYVAIGILFARLDGEKGTKVGIACNMSYVVEALQLKDKIAGLKVANDWDYP